MATKTLSRLAGPSSPFRPSSVRISKPTGPFSHHYQRRTFLPNPFPNPFIPTSPAIQTLSAKRTLPYPVEPIYNIISDVSSYAHFLPYCQSSVVTKWSSPDATYNQKWPSEARLVVGWGQVTEEFTSRVFCVPGKVVEAVSGQTDHTLSRSELAHYTEILREREDMRRRVGGVAEDKAGLLTHLLTRWSVEPVTAAGSEACTVPATTDAKYTKVDLSIEFAFANPMYAALSAGVAPMVADRMIKAFEDRVKVVLGR